MGPFCDVAQPRRKMGPIFWMPIYNRCPKDILCDVHTIYSPIGKSLTSRHPVHKQKSSPPDGRKEFLFFNFIISLPMIRSCIRNRQWFSPST